MSTHKILLVEDDKLQAKTTKEYLEKAGHEIVWVENGMAAIKAATSTSFDLIVLDLVLPDIGGHEVCRWLKSTKNTQDIPIIILSAKGKTEEKVVGLEAGADDYLPKPYDPSELKARIYAGLKTKVLQDELRKKNQRLEEVLQQMETLAMTDQLTELFNRRYFQSVIEKEISRSIRYKYRTSCLMIDIDHFKKINDTYGHHVGDQVLAGISRIMTTCLRKSDTLARWGGEEFIILLPNTTEENALQVALRILTNVSSFQWPALGGPVTVSIGISSLPSANIDTSDQLIAAADSALYRAKSNGRNRVESYLPEGG